MTGIPSITLYCVPPCGHARAIRELLRRRGLPFAERDLNAPEVQQEVMEAFHLRGSPVLVVGDEVLTGHARIVQRIEEVAAAARR